MSELSVTKENYRWILLKVFVQIMVYFAVNMSNGRLRASYFTPSFMEDNFGATFKDLGKPVPQLGVPDCGNGRFSDKLPYDKWVSYNCAQYTANTAIQSITSTVLITLGLGIYLPITGLVVGLFFIVWRIVHIVVGRMNASSLAILEPLNHAFHLAGLITVGVAAMHTSQTA